GDRSRPGQHLELDFRGEAERGNCEGALHCHRGFSHGLYLQVRNAGTSWRVGHRYGRQSYPISVNAASVRVVAGFAPPGRGEAPSPPPPTSDSGAQYSESRCDSCWCRPSAAAVPLDDNASSSWVRIDAI